jgi:hypothetical protein
MNRKFFLTLALALAVVLVSLTSAHAQSRRRPSRLPTTPYHGRTGSPSFPGSGHNAGRGNYSFPGSGTEFPGSGWGWQEGYFYLPDGTFVYGVYKVYSFEDDPSRGGFPSNYSGNRRPRR